MLPSCFGNGSFGTAPRLSWARNLAAMQPHDSDGTSAPPGASAEASLSRDEVAHLARLSRIAVTEDELDTFSGQLEVILAAVARVGEVAAPDVPPMTHAVGLVNVTRPDQVRACLDPSDVLAGAPAAEEQRFRVPQILTEEA